MIRILTTAKRRRELVNDAADARQSKTAVYIAWVAVIVYNFVGVSDIISTVLGLELGLGEEANPFLRMMMEQAGSGWITAKLMLQGLISVMVLWFPHWIVLTMFSLATVGNAAVVYNNLAIIGLV